MTRARTQIALVLGSDEVASGIARALHRAGYRVVLTDEIDPPCPLRGLSYVGAWYFGAAELGGVGACFCSSIKSVPEIIDRQRLVATTAWSVEGLSRALSPALLVDARAANGNAAGPRRGVPGKPLIVVGGPASGRGDEAAVAIDPSFGSTAGRPIRLHTSAIDLHLPWRLDGADANGWVVAARDGRFHTELRVGTDVAEESVIGTIQGALLHAGIAGRVVALTLRGARVPAGQLVAVIDEEPAISRLAALSRRADRIANGVISVLASQGSRLDVVESIT